MQIRYVFIPCDSSCPLEDRVVELESTAISYDSAYLIPLLLKHVPVIYKKDVVFVCYPTFNESLQHNIPLLIYKKNECQTTQENRRAQNLVEQCVDNFWQKELKFLGDVFAFWRRDVDELRHEFKIGNLTVKGVLKLLGALEKKKSTSQLTSGSLEKTASFDHAFQGKVNACDSLSSKNERKGSDFDGTTSSSSHIKSDCHEFSGLLSGQNIQTFSTERFLVDTTGEMPDGKRRQKMAYTEARGNTNKEMDGVCDESQTLKNLTIHEAVTVLQSFVSTFLQQLPLVNLALKTFMEFSLENCKKSNHTREDGIGQSLYSKNNLIGNFEKVSLLDMSKVSKKLEQFVQCNREELSQDVYHKELDRNQNFPNSMNTNETLIKENTVLSLSNSNTGKVENSTVMSDHSYPYLKSPKIQEDGINGNKDNKHEMCDNRKKNRCLTKRRWIVTEAYEPSAAVSNDRFANLAVGDIVMVQKADNSGWWWVSNRSTFGWFPCSFLEAL